MSKEYFNVAIENLFEVINYNKEYSFYEKDLDNNYLEKYYYSLYQVADMLNCNPKSLKNRISSVKVNILIFTIYKDSKDKRYFFRKEQIGCQFELYKKSIKVSEAYKKFINLFGNIISKNTFLSRFNIYKIDVLGKNTMFLDKSNLEKFLNYVKEENSIINIAVNIENSKTNKTPIEISRNYYTSEDVRKMFGFGKSVLSRFCLSSNVDDSKILKCGNKYFFEKKYIDNQYAIFKECITFEEMLKELKDEYGNIPRSSLYNKIKNKIHIPIMNDSVFVYLRDYEELKKLYKIINRVKEKTLDFDYFIKNINLENNAQFEIIASTYYKKNSISVLDLEADYYSMNYISDTFGINRKLIPDRCKKNNKINYIKLYDCRYFFEKKYIDSQIKILKESILTTEAFKIFDDKFKGALTVGAFLKKFEFYNIDLFADLNFIKKSYVENFINDVENFMSDECISTRELREQINECLLGFNYVSCFREKTNFLIDKLNIRYYERADNENIYGKRMIPKKECIKIIDYIIKNTFSFIESGLDKELDMADIKKYMLEDRFYNYDEAKIILKNLNIKIYEKSNIERNLKNKGIRSFKMKNKINEVFFLKLDFDNVIRKIQNSVKVKDIVEKAEKDLGKIIDVHVTGNYVESKGFKVYKLTFCGNEIFVEKKYAVHLYNILKYEEEFRACITEYEKLNIRLKYNSVDNRIPKTIDLFKKYCLNKSNKTKNQHINKTFYDLYVVLCKNISRDLCYMKIDEIEDLFENLVNYNLDRSNLTKELIMFFKYLKVELDLDTKISFSHNENKEEKEPYEKEAFFKLFLSISEILFDYKLYSLMFRERMVSSSLLYVYSHYFLAWRKQDLINSFPIPSLKYVGGWENAEEFIEWLENGNEFSEDMGILTCEYIEEAIKRINSRIQKTDEKLILIIPKVAAKSLGLLICISEANRQIASKKKHKRNKTDTLIAVSISDKILRDVFNKKYSVNLEKLLDGSFSNIRANKSFISNVSNKAEEFALAIGYYYSQKFRNHKSNKNLLSEVTNIYLRKDVSTASVLAFLSGTMGSIKYLLLDLIDNDFSKKSRIEKAEEVISLPMSNLEIEKSLKIISEKSNLVNANLSDCIKNNKMIFLKELLYGQHYGKHEEIKCLFKIIRKSNNNILKIAVFENKDCMYNKDTCIGCEYMIATKYFIYEFAKRFNELLSKIEKATNKYEREIHLEILVSSYIPIVLEVQKEFGKEKINQIFNISTFNKIRKFEYNHQYDN